MGHKRTIRPNAKRLSAIFMERDKMGWNTFARKVKSCQRGFMGEPEEVRPGRGEFHEYPAACICKKTFKFSRIRSRNIGDRSSDKVLNSTEARVEHGDDTDYQRPETYDRLNNTGMVKVPVPLTEVDEDDFLAD